MPTLKAPSRILVTGASGFLGTGIVEALVNRGYIAVGTVRSVKKGDSIKQKYGDKFEYVVVEDMEKPGAYDEAVKNVDGIIHAASVVKLSGSSSAEFIDPAVKGTTGILESARLHGPAVKRIIITSSVAAITDYLPEPKEFTDADWNTQTVKKVEEEGDKANPVDMYGASKILAEQAAWDYVKKHQVSYDITTIIPPFILGPLLYEVPSDFSALNASMAIFYRNTFVDLAVPWSGNFVDLRDVSLAHVLALEVEEAGSKRLLVSAFHKFWQEIRDDLRRDGVSNVPEGTLDSYKGQTPHMTYEGTKAAKLLGLEYRPFIETAKDAVESIRAKFPETN